jgi:2-haloacid dehalogenase
VLFHCSGSNGFEASLRAWEPNSIAERRLQGCQAHVGDLQAARSYGLRTGFIYRPNEYGGGPVGVPDKAKRGDFDVVSVSIVDLAHQLGA